MKNCVICDAADSAYKCPKCRCFYCSSKCFKCHQEKTCEIKTITGSEETNTDYKHVTEDTVLAEKLKLLNDSKELKTILDNRHVRDILLEIDKNPNPNEIMERAMKEPIFVEFADACLKLVENE